MTNHDAANGIDQLRDLLATVPPQVNQPKDIQIAEDLILGVGGLVLTSTESSLQHDPDRPHNAGLSWDNLSEQARRTYAQTMVHLDQIRASENADNEQIGNPDYVGVSAPPPEMLAKALAEVRFKLLRLGELMQQPYSGMVQRDS